VDLKRVIDGTTSGGGGAPGCSESHISGQGVNNPLQSPHPGGVLVAMVDGSVQFISGTTDLAVFLRLAIRDDGQNVKLD
jgi:prepilin-type processing-associated H-X9-DG protein